MTTCTIHWSSWQGDRFAPKSPPVRFPLPGYIWYGETHPTPQSATGKVAAAAAERMRGRGGGGT